MTSEPKFMFGSAYAVFSGESNLNTFHQNAAFQIVISNDEEIVVIDETDRKYVGKIILIKPLIKSKIQSDAKVIHLYLSPRISLTLDLIKLVGDANIRILDNPENLPFNVDTKKDDIIKILDKFDQVSIERLDPRLLKVLEDLNQNLDNPSIFSAAQRCGLSRSRVRTLAREQLGIPLSTWVTWRKLVKANKALSTGANLSDAALEGHFSDQAHFTRTMKRMFGVTPTDALRIYTY